MSEEIVLRPKPGEETVRAKLNNSLSWTVLFTDQLREKNCTLFYLETKAPCRFRNFYQDVVNMKYLSVVWAANPLMAKDPGAMAGRLISIANSELKEAIQAAAPK